MHLKQLLSVLLCLGILGSSFAGCQRQKKESADLASASNDPISSLENLSDYNTATNLSVDSQAVSASSFAASIEEAKNESPSTSQKTDESSSEAPLVSKEPDVSDNDAIGKYPLVENTDGKSGNDIPFQTGVTTEYVYNLEAKFPDFDIQLPIWDIRIARSPSDIQAILSFNANGGELDETVYAAFQKYDDAFFENHSLIMVSRDYETGSTKTSVKRLSVDGGNLYIEFVNKRPDGTPQDNPRRCLPIEVTASDLTNVQSIYYSIETVIYNFAS